MATLLPALSSDDENPVIESDEEEDEMQVDKNFQFGGSTVGTCGV